MSKEPLFVAVSNQKGGVGKSALTVVLSSYLHFEKNLNVAIIDCDSPQHSLVRMRNGTKKPLPTVSIFSNCYSSNGIVCRRRPILLSGLLPRRQGKRRTNLPQTVSTTDFCGFARNGRVHGGVPHHRQYGLCPDSHHSRPYHHAEHTRIFHDGA